VHIPDSVVARLEGAADQRAEGKRICIEMIQALREEPGVAGVHVMAYRQSQYVAEIVGESGVLRGRAPWRRDFVAKMQPVESLEAG
jgi:5,10-methylenetetrahydrofolate reductase